MEDNQIKSFVDSVVNYFGHLRDKDVSVGTPFLMKQGEKVGYELSGRIGISGTRTGWVRYTAPRVMLRHWLLSMGETNTSGAYMRDVIGEVANTISGNLRRAFGSKFLISLPEVTEGDSVSPPAGERCYVVPVYWRQYQSAMVIYLH